MALEFENFHKGYMDIWPISKGYMEFGWDMVTIHKFWA
jgi:hypothetical protein